MPELRASPGTVLRYLLVLGGLMTPSPALAPPPQPVKAPAEPAAKKATRRRRAKRRFCTAGT
jgi:hypothetical protein